MKKLFLLVLTLTASASPPFQEEKLPFRDQPFDHMVKVDVLPVLKKEPIVQNTEEEQGPLMQDEPVAGVVEPDSVLLEPETTEEHRVSEKTSVMVEEPVLKADNLTPETELETEPEIDAIQMNRKNVPVEEPVLEADFQTPETELEPEPETDAIEMNTKNVPVEEPVLEADYLTEETPETELEPEPEIDAIQMNRKNVPVEEPVLEADFQTPETELEPEPETDAIEMNTKNVPVEEPVLEADYLTEETPETELEPELEIDAIEMNTNNLHVEEPVVVMESWSSDEMVVESVKEEHLLEESTLEGDYIVVEDPEEVMEPGRERRMTLKTGRRTCRGVVLQGKCYQFFRRTLDANTAELQCQDICPNGHLASVTSSHIREEMGKLMDQYGGRTQAWLGGRRDIGTNNFKWLDGAQWSYNNWASGEPNNAGGMENCVEILSYLPFSDVPCNILKPFICSCPL